MGNKVQVCLPVEPVLQGQAPPWVGLFSVTSQLVENMMLHGICEKETHRAACARAALTHRRPQTAPRTLAQRASLPRLRATKLS